jgi:hypothetical protein
MRTRIIGIALGFGAVTACAAGDAGRSADSPNLAQFVSKAQGSASSGSSSVGVQPAAPPVIATNVDPCTFFSKGELESAFGVRFGPPKRGRDEPSCRFYNSTTGSVTVRAGEQVSVRDFDALREQIGAEAERVSGIGESAYFWGPKLYVRGNGRQLVIYVSTDQLTPQLRTALITLGRLGASRLRA